MARIALVDASSGSVTAVRAAAGPDHEVVCCGLGAVPPDAALLVIDAGGGPAATEEPARVASGRPVLLLLERRVQPDVDRPANFHFLQKPCEILALRAQFRAMLESVPAPAATPLPACAEWLQAPRVPAAAAAILHAARRLGGPIWIAGEPGAGTDRAAGALARAWDSQRLPVVWQDDEVLDAVTVRLTDPDRVLWAPAVHLRPAAEQVALARFLAIDGARRVVVTTGDDPDGTGALLVPSLHRRLARVSLRLPPLRERAADLAGLATLIGATVAATVGDGARFVLADGARASLESYDWPGNLDELEAVIVRSVLARGVVREGVVELSEADLRYAPDFASASGLRGQESPAPRRAVVVPLGSARSLESSSDKSAHESVQPEHSQQSSAADSGVEAVLAAFAHDIRNPMSTLKTFATLAAAGADEGSAELARLATGAAERIDAQLEYLQRYTELAAGDARAASARVDAVDVLGEAVEAAGGGLQVAARAALWIGADPEALRFVADALVAESVDRLRDGAQPGQGEATADLSADKRSLELRIPVGGMAVDRLGKWVEGRGLPWRLALARDLARRGGGDLGVDGEDGEMRVRWTPGPVAEAEEVERDGGEARSADRRRRGRSS